MKWLPDRVGAEPKKLAVLAGLFVVLAVVYYINSSSGPGASTTPASAPGSVQAPPAVSRVAPVQSKSAPASKTVPRNATMRRGESSITDFKPTLKLPEDVDVSRIDPSLHLDAIAKLRGVGMEGGQRSLFDFGPAPKPATPPPPVQPIKPAPLPAAANPNIPPPAPVKPAPPPIPLRFYGYVNGSVGGSRQAFFLEGDEIYVAGENDLIHNRYRVIRIGVNSAVVEDTATKNQQTLPLVEELPG